MASAWRQHYSYGFHDPPDSIRFRMKGTVQMPRGGSRDAWNFFTMSQGSAQSCLGPLRRPSDPRYGITIDRTAFPYPRPEHPKIAMFNNSDVRSVSRGSIQMARHIHDLRDHAHRF